MQPPVPKVVIDPVQLGKLAELCCTLEEVAAYFRTTVVTVKFRLKKDPLKTIWESGLARGRISIRRAQFQAALAGDRTMLIWIGKQLLSQTDKVEQNVETKQKWVVELPPAMTAEQWVAAYGKIGGDVVTPAGPANPATSPGPPVKRKAGRPRGPNSVLNRMPLNRDDRDEMEEEEEIPER